MVQSVEYLRSEFEDDTVAPQISGNDMWGQVDVIVEGMEPMILVLRLTDSNAPTLSKVKVTVDLVASKMIDTGNETLTDRISACFHRMVPELTSDIANAAYVLDPQFVRNSKDADQSVMLSFWKVARTSLHITDDDA